MISGYCGIYRHGPYGDGGDQGYQEFEVSETGLGSAWRSALNSAARFSGKFTFTSHPYGFCKGSVDAGGIGKSGTVLANGIMDAVNFESVGNGNIFCSGSVEAGVNRDAMDCVVATNCFDDGSGRQLDTTVTDWQGVAVGRMNALIDLNGGDFAGNHLIGGRHESTARQLHRLRLWPSGEGSIKRRIRATTLITRLQADYKPRSNTASGYRQPTRSYASTATSALSTMRAGRSASAISSNTRAATTPAWPGSTGSAKPVGVALTPATAPTAVLGVQSGVVSIHLASNAISASATVIRDGTNNGAAVSSGSPALATYVGPAQQANSGAFATVQLQGLA